MTKREVLLIGLFLAVIGFFWMRGCDKKKDTQAASTALAPNVVEKLIINPDTHKLTIVTPGHEDVLFLPDRPASIELNRQGHINVTLRQWGTELKPFVGFGYADTWRGLAGLDIGYWKRLDSGLFISGGIKAPVALGLGFSYTVYSNTRLTLGYDTQHAVNLALTLRL